MNWFWAASLGLVVFFTALFRSERLALIQARARGRAVFLSGARYILAMLLFLALPLALRVSVLAALDVGLFVFALLVLPTSLVLRLGGQVPKLELRHVQREAAALMAAQDGSPSAEAMDSMRELIGHVDSLRTAETNELCSLLVARYSDWIAGSSRPLDLGRRSIRVYEIDRELYGDEIRPPEHDQEEATFRWRLYRVFGELVDAGSAGRTPEARARFKECLAELEAYRRPDTAGFIDSVKASAQAWLKSRRSRPWQPAIGVGDVGQAIEDAQRQLWPSASAFWGAILDEEDRRELAPARRRGA
jgi:hypothetical protein